MPAFKRIDWLDPTADHPVRVPHLGAFERHAFGPGFDRGKKFEPEAPKEWFTREDADRVAEKVGIRLQARHLRALNFYANVYVEQKRNEQQLLTPAETREQVEQIHTVAKRLLKLIDGLEKGAPDFSEEIFHGINASFREDLARLQSQSGKALRHFPSPKGTKKRGRKAGQKDMAALKFIHALADIFQDATGRRPTATEGAPFARFVYRACLFTLLEKLEQEGIPPEKRERIEVGWPSLYSYLKERPEGMPYIAPFKKTT